MGQIFIIEGPDGAGKTTLARSLGRFLNQSTYVHLGPPKPYEDVLHQYAMVLYNAHVSPNPTIIDRLHIGESIYGPILRGQDRLGNEGLNLLKRMISGYGAVEIICLPPYAIAADNWRANAKNELLKKTVDYEKVYAGYAALMSKWEGFIHDYTDKITVATPKMISDYKVPPLPEGVIGSRQPKFLFVGDVANHDDLDAPFIALNGSSHFLYEHILAAGFQEDEMAFMNSTSLAGAKLNVTAIWHNLKNPITVCLGDNAKKRCHHPTHHIPHPAYWARFKSTNPGHYTELLKVIRGNSVYR